MLGAAETAVTYLGGAARRDTGRIENRERSPAEARGEREPHGAGQLDEHEATMPGERAAQPVAQESAFPVVPDEEWRASGGERTVAGVGHYAISLPAWSSIETQRTCSATLMGEIAEKATTAATDYNADGGRT